MLYISNFVLELFNLNALIMKKAVSIFTIAALVIITVVLWFINSDSRFDSARILPFAVLAIVLIFALFFGFKRFASAKRGEPTEDELSKKIVTKASSIAFYISIYLWLFLMYMSDKTKMETHTLIGTGILGMAITFALCWVIIYFRGISND